MTRTLVPDSESSEPDTAPAPAVAEPASPRTSGSDPDFMLSLARGLLVLRAFDQAHPQLSVAEVSRITGLSRAASRRCLYTLVTLGYASNAGGLYELTPAVLSLASTYLGSAPLARLAQPILERVSEQIHESSSLAVLDGDEIVYVARAATRRILSIGISVGTRLPAACTSMGRVLLAFADESQRTGYLARVELTRYTPRTIVDKAQLRAELDTVRGQGYAMVDQELEIGLRSMAVPVRRADGAVIAAINVGVHAVRADRETLLREFLPVLQDAAGEIGAALTQPVGR